MTTPIEWLRDPEHRFKLAVYGLAVSIPAWPLSALTVFKHEPPGILGLSWLSLILQLAVLAATTDVRREQ